MLDSVRFPEISPQYYESSGSANLIADRPDLEDHNDPIVRFSTSEWGDMVKSEEKLVLVGRFARQRPPLDLLRANMKRSLRLEGEVLIGSLDRRSILLRFELEADRYKTWIRSQAIVEGCRLWFSRWTPDWCSIKDSPMALVWFQLPKLPIHLFNFDSIARICAPLGRAIGLDEATNRRTRPSVAKVRIEIDVLKPVVERIWVQYLDEGGEVKGFWQAVVRERVPAYCSCCSRFGHSLENCWRREGGRNERRQGEGEMEGRGVTVEDEEGDPMDMVTPAVCENRMVAGNDVPTACDQGENIHAAVVEEAVTKVMEEEIEEEVCEKGGDEDQSQENSSPEEEEYSQSVSYRTWAENLKNKAGEDSDLIKVIEEAKREVDHFFQLAFKELGKEIYDECSDEIVKKANEFFLLKLEREGKEIGSRLKKELGWIEKDTSATKRNENGESDESSNASSKRKGRVIKNSMDWVDIVKEFMEKDNEFERKVKEAMKAVNDYLWTVFDKGKKAYLEEEKDRAVRGAAIFLEIVKQSPAWGAENNLLGRILKANQELIGGRICIWAEEWNL